MRTCPKCHQWSFEYDGNASAWRCLRTDCDYSEPDPGRHGKQSCVNCGAQRARTEVAEKKLADVMAKSAELYEEGKRIAHASEAIVRRAEAAERRADKWPGIAERLAEALSEHMVLCRLCYYGGREQVPDVCDAECPEYEKCTSYHAFAAHEARVKE